MLYGWDGAEEGNLGTPSRQVKSMSMWSRPDRNQLTLVGGDEGLGINDVDMEGGQGLGSLCLFFWFRHQ